MSSKPAVQIGDKVLRQKAKTVGAVFAPEIQKTIEDLVDSMRHENLVGMAAPQIGKSVQIFVTEIRQTTYRKNISESDSLRVFINPKIIEKSVAQLNAYEGCGSVVGAQLFGAVKRAKTVTCEALDAEGKSFKIKALGFLARVIQHEIDHLNGRLFIDCVSDTKTLMDRKAYMESQKS